MQQVITSEQAKKITGGRTPLVPVEYEEAIKALKACQSLDESKRWSDRGDMLAAWGKLYRDSRALLEAKKLKLYAYRRMGELAKELRPKRYLPSGGSPPGNRALLVEQGLLPTQAIAAAALGNMKENEFQKLMGQPSPPSPIHAYRLASSQRNSTSAWVQFKHDPAGGIHFRSWIRSHPAQAFISALKADEKFAARDIATELAAWIEEVGGWVDEVLKRTD